MHKSIPLAQPIQPDTRPGGQIVPPNLVVANGEPHKRKLVDKPGDALELELLRGEVEVAALVRLGARLVLALVDVAVALRVAVFGGFDVDLDLDVGLEALGGLFAPRQGDVLRGEEGKGQGDGFAGDGDGVGGVVFGRELGAVS